MEGWALVFPVTHRAVGSSFGKAVSWTTKRRQLVIAVVVLVSLSVENRFSSRCAVNPPVKPTRLERKRKLRDLPATLNRYDKTKRHVSQGTPPPPRPPR